MSRRHQTRYTNNNNPGGRLVKQAAYDAKILHEFVMQFHRMEVMSGGVVKDGGASRWYKYAALNGKRMSADDLRRMRRWGAEMSKVSLSATDTFLMRYGLMTWELEQFAEEKHGWNGLSDPTS